MLDGACCCSGRWQHSEKPAWWCHSAPIRMMFTDCCPELNQRQGQKEPSPAAHTNTRVILERRRGSCLLRQRGESGKKEMYMFSPDCGGPSRCLHSYKVWTMRLPQWGQGQREGIKATSYSEESIRAETHWGKRNRAVLEIHWMYISPVTWCPSCQPCKRIAAGWLRGC